MLVAIQNALPLQQREFQNRMTGKLDVFYTKAFILSDGLNTFYAEAQGNLARSLEANPLDKETFVNVELAFRVHRYENANKEERFSTDVIIQRIANFE